MKECHENYGIETYLATDGSYGWNLFVAGDIASKDGYDSQFQALSAARILGDSVDERSANKRQDLQNSASSFST